MHKIYLIMKGLFSLSILLLFAISSTFGQLFGGQIKPANRKQCLPSYVPTNGLVGWWPFCGNANDESGNGNNGTVNGATLTDDRYGNTANAFSFDGNDWITIANSISGQINNAVTISSWVNVNSWFSNTYFPVLTNTDQTATFGKLGCYLRNNGAWSHFGNQETGFGTSYILNTWYHTVFTIQGGIFSFYVNGQLILSSPPCCTINGFGFNNNLPLLIGKDTPGITEYSNGKIDDIGIWNRALTQQEITDLYQSGCLVVGEIEGPSTVMAGSSISLSDTTAGGSWSSSNVSIATVDNSGLVTGLAPGTDTIRYTVNTVCGVVTKIKVITVSLQLGQYYQGGIIAFLDGSGQHGLIVSQSEYTGLWGCVGNLAWSQSDGYSNTSQATSLCNSPHLAVTISWNLILNGYSDWFLPAKDQLLIVYQNVLSQGVLPMTGIYWSSSSYSTNWAWSLNTGGVFLTPHKEGYYLYFRPVRNF